MTLESLRMTIDAERALLLPLHQKVTSPFLKQQCEFALNTLEDLEHFYFGGGFSDPAALVLQSSTFVKVVTDQRRAVEEAVSNFGYNAIAAPHDL